MENDERRNLQQMDLLKVKIYLDKINRDFARMNKDPETILRIDVDIMMANVRELYDALLSEEAELAPAAKQEQHRKASAPRQPDPVEAPTPIASAPAPPPAPPPVQEAPPPPVAAPAAPPPLLEERPAPAPPPPPVVVEPVRPAEPLPQVKPPASAAPVSFPAIPPEAEILFEQKQAKELSEKLSELPIQDLRKAIALNDRLLLTRELYGGDNQAFDNAINALNGFQNMEQAKAYLLDHCVMRYRWTDKKHIETAKNFIKLVRRRYN